MNYTMDAGYRTRTFRNFIKVHDVKSIHNPDPSFLRKMAEAASATGPVRLSTEQMSMEEYKDYLYDRISQLPVHPTNMQDSVSIQISEDGLRAMKEDPEYEQWVLDSVKTNFAARDPWSGMCGGKYVILYFGAQKELSRGESWRAGYLNGSGNRLFEKKSENSFWERRTQRRKELAEQYEQILELKELNKDLDPGEGLYYGELAILAALRPKPVETVM